MELSAGVRRGLRPGLLFSPSARSPSPGRSLDGAWSIAEDRSADTPAGDQAGAWCGPVWKGSVGPGPTPRAGCGCVPDSNMLQTSL